MSTEEDLKKDIKANLIELIQLYDEIPEKRRKEIIQALKHPSTSVSTNAKQVKLFLQLVFGNAKYEALCRKYLLGEHASNKQRRSRT